MEASVRRRWRESSKRSSASAGAGAPFRGIAMARPTPRPTRKRSRGSCHDATTGVIEMSPEHNSAVGSSRSESARPARFRGTIASRAFRSRVGRRWTIAPGRSGRPMPHRSDSAAGAASLQRLGLCIAGLKQPSARRVETTEAVAKRYSDIAGARDRLVAIAALPLRMRGSRKHSSPGCDFHFGERAAAASRSRRKTARFKPEARRLVGQLVAQRDLTGRWVVASRRSCCIAADSASDASSEATGGAESEPGSRSIGHEKELRVDGTRAASRLDEAGLVLANSRYSFCFRFSLARVRFRRPREATSLRAPRGSSRQGPAFVQGSVTSAILPWTRRPPSLQPSDQRVGRICRISRHDYRRALLGQVSTIAAPIRRLAWSRSQPDQ